MPWYKIPGAPGMVHIHFGARGNRNAPRPCRICRAIAPFLCDWKIAPGKTCDTPICAEHAFEVVKDKHLCPRHQADYKTWLLARNAQASPSAPIDAEGADA